MAELSTLSGFFESKRKRMYDSYAYASLLIYIVNNNCIIYYDWPERIHYHKVTKLKDNLTFKLYFSNINRRQKPEF